MSRLSHISVEQHPGLVNLAIAAVVGLLAWFSWWIMQEKPPEPAQQRSFDGVTVRWKCDQGHEYQAAGACAPQACPTCGADAYVVLLYRCGDHGEMEARLRHELNEDDNLVLAGICFVGAAWTDYPEDVCCPYCGRRLQQVRPNIFANAKNKGRQP